MMHLGLLYFDKIMNGALCRGGGGTLTLEGSMGTCCPQDPLFRQFLAPETDHFKPFPASEIPLLFFEQNYIFKPNFCRF